MLSGDAEGTKPRRRLDAGTQPGERGAVMCDGLLVLAEVIQFQTFDLLLGAGNLFA